MSLGNCSNFSFPNFNVLGQTLPFARKKKITLKKPQSSFWKTLKMENRASSSPLHTLQINNNPTGFKKAQKQSCFCIRGDLES